MYMQRILPAVTIALTLVIPNVALGAQSGIGFSGSDDVEFFSMPILSKKAQREKFTHAEREFSKRWIKFSRNRKFKRFHSNFSDEEILKDFREIFATRISTYYENPGEVPLFANYDYERAQTLMEGGYFKETYLTAFDYNHSCNNFNSSNVSVNGHRFLALEGPQKPDHVSNFKTLLINYNVKSLVRLTNDIEKGKFKSENYWKGATTEDENGQQVLSIVTDDQFRPSPHYFPYYTISNWADNTGTSPSFLLEFVQTVRKNHKHDDIMAVHCSAGVGRSGTFIASYLLLDEIDKQTASGVPQDEIKLSIEELVYKLSLQRAYLVGEPAQYLTIHKVVALYLSQLPKVS